MFVCVCVWEGGDFFLSPFRGLGEQMKLLFRRPRAICPREKKGGAFSGASQRNISGSICALTSFTADNALSTTR